MNKKQDGRYWTVPIRKLSNGGKVPPVEGDLLIYRSTPGQRVGHVAVVVEVLESCVRVAEQNQENDKLWSGSFADELPMKIGLCTDGELTYTIIHRDPILELQGWVRLEEHHQKPRDEWAQPAAFLGVDGIYNEDTCKALQTLCGGFADGEHGGLTSSNLRTFLHCHGRAEDNTTSKEPDDLVRCLRSCGPSSTLAHRPSSRPPALARVRSAPSNERPFDPAHMRRRFLVYVWPLSQPTPSVPLDAEALFREGYPADGVCYAILCSAPAGAPVGPPPMLLTVLQCPLSALALPAVRAPTAGAQSQQCCHVHNHSAAPSVLEPHPLCRGPAICDVTNAAGRPCLLACNVRVRPMGVAATGTSNQVTYHGRASRYSRDAVASGPEMLAAVQAPVIT